eukprot:gene40844-50538_t
MQQHAWNSFDLSFNKFTGELSSSFRGLVENASINLDVN